MTTIPRWTIACGGASDCVTFPGASRANTTFYFKGAEVPVWVMAEDVDGEAGAHLVYVSVAWGDYPQRFRFAGEIMPGSLTVFVPRAEDADDMDPTDACRF